MNLEIPGDLSNQSESNSNYGTLITTFQGREIKPRTWLLVFIPGFMAICLSLLFGTILARNAYLVHGPALAIIRAQPWFLLTVTLLFILVPYFVYCVLNKVQRLFVYEDGFTIRGPLFRVHSYRWSDISGIAYSENEITFLGKNFRTIPKGVIHLRSGRQINIKNRFQGISQLTKIIKKKIYPLLWPSIKSTFSSGNVVKFGGINVNQHRVTVYDNSIPWSAIHRIRITSGNLVVELRDKFKYEIPLENITNLELLFKTIDWGISE
jgi:hypothetical protein